MNERKINRSEHPAFGKSLVKKPPAPEVFFAKAKITDSGIGIDDDVKDKIFTPTGQAKAPGRVWGIPL
jgi:signal transduction histidine kinase